MPDDNREREAEMERTRLNNRADLPAPDPLHSDVSETGEPEPSHPEPSLFRSFTRADEDDPDVRDEMQWEWDHLVGLFRAYQLDLPDSPAYSDPGFFAWLAREERASADEDGRDPEVWSEDEISAAARELMSSTEAALASMHQVNHAPVTRRAAIAGSVAHTIEEASADRCAPRLELAPAAGAGRALWDEECETWVEVPEGMPAGKYLALDVAGESMTPLLHAGDVILVQIGSEAKRGDVVVARLPDDGYVVKRVGRIRSATIELLSLNPDYAAINLPRRKDAILGAVVLRWCVHDLDGLGRPRAS